jgi:hypothetical protein
MLTPAHRPERPGLVPSATNLVFDIVERSQLMTLSMLQDVRIELRGVVDHAIELGDKTTGTVWRLARKLTQRLDDTAGAALGGLEHLVAGAMPHARETARATTGLVNSVGDALLGARMTNGQVRQPPSA